ncbi:doublecortin domain-containing protein 2B isoform X1 [Dunckerocampus dactyliophorus]|uniref:doublecortin domain-containing protein 2B isoform X1 n=2 Tax=Dunckerocampus dactyliophorus TaxID=161453 RepID=UPI0024067E0E|nr:doublecortin domain-containing protein 2B isoform X1 [Dunckerocampus dactyliophorus]
MDIIRVCVCVCVVATSEMATGTAATTVLPSVKSVVVYRNGDPFFNGRRFVINQRQVSTMEAFLNEVTQNIGAPLAVRTLYTPRQGHKVTDFQDLQTGAQYVAAGFEKFKKLDYVNTGVKKQPATRDDTQAKLIQRPNVSAKWRKFVPVPCIIHVFRNGDLLCPPFRFIIPRSMQRDLEQILSMVTEKVSLRTGAVRRLCSVEGVTVTSAGELETGRCYVAVGTERFKKLPYVELLVSKAAERYYPGKRRTLRRNVHKKPGSGPEDQCSDSALLNSPESDGRRVKSTGDEAAPPPAPQQQQQHTSDGAEDGSLSFAKPVRIRKTRGTPRPPLGNGTIHRSVFKPGARRRREEVRGAEEVQEDENTATELPVDQRIAETVEDEELNNANDALHDTLKVLLPSDPGEAEKTTTRNKEEEFNAENLEFNKMTLSLPDSHREIQENNSGHRDEKEDRKDAALLDALAQNHHQGEGLTEDATSP